MNKLRFPLQMRQMLVRFPADRGTPQVSLQIRKFIKFLALQAESDGTFANEVLHLEQR